MSVAASPINAALVRCIMYGNLLISSFDLMTIVWHKLVIGTSLATPPAIAALKPSGGLQE
jgi:hypothetical protein